MRNKWPKSFSENRTSFNIVHSSPRSTKVRWKRKAASGRTWRVQRTPAWTERRDRATRRFVGCGERHDSVPPGMTHAQTKRSKRKIRKEQKKPGWFFRKRRGCNSLFSASATGLRQRVHALACVPCSLPLWQRCTLCYCLLRLWRRHLAWTRLILCVKTKMFQTNVPRRDAPRAEPHSRKRSLSLDEVLKFVVRVYSELSSSAVAISPYFAEIVALTSNFTIQFSIEFAKPSRRP